MTAPTILAATPAATVNGPDYCLAPDAAFLMMSDGSGRILDMADSFCAVAPVGALMVRETLRHGEAAAARLVADTFGAPLERVRGDLRRFLASLEQRRILERRSQVRGRPPRAAAAGLATGLLKVALGVLPPVRARAAVLLTQAKLSLRLFGWPATVAAWRQRFPQRDGRLSPREVQATAVRIDDAVGSAAAGNLFGVACKERALCAWALARGAGLPAALVIGVELYPLAGHCWCEVGQRVVSDHPDNVARYVPALRYT
jgi:hypothetical protein